jgi:tRNA (cytidine/uridine-2'-O-)-methyltransferase
LIDIVLYEPEIPMNTGNIARTCAATGARLNLIEPLGFDISDRAVKRAGLDYWHLVEVCVFGSIEEYFAARGDANIWLATTKAPRSYTEADLSGDVALIFGKETAGLPAPLLEKYREKCIRIPIRSEARCLNLSNSAAVLCYEALRQQGFPGLLDRGIMASTNL